MLRRLRENGPVVLVPLAWTFAIAAHLDVLALRTVLIAHLVMDAVLVAFTVLSWSAMRRGVLRAWRLVLLVGLALTLVGTTGLLQTPPASSLLWLTVVGWLLVPAGGLAYTGRHVDRSPLAYTGGAVLSALGAIVYVAGTLVSGDPLVPVAGLAVAGVGQTAGIVAAVRDY
ncbi:hypothetical protein IL252_16395 [Halomicrobium sp. IBSBa]|uniref:hypothetical protein n=1 Tax=Halomicrobium sp. IBSBa TaxID=2778916 RepID=UPI001ABF914F|nr:hypothetical protein [Halomicrobium sp. IBSBa]MBO4249392.1 hypothetical protein [Halomicrobium sp. IBSBa]